MGVIQDKSILQMLRDGQQIVVGQGTFGGPGSVYADKWADRFNVLSGATSRVMFKEPAGQGTKTFVDTNTPASQVPAGQRWDLMGMFFSFQKVDGSALLAGEKQAFNAWIQSMRVTVKYGTQIVFSEPMWPHFGSQLSQETAISTTTALQSTTPKPLVWGGFWPEECHVPLSSNVVLDVNLEFAAAGATIGVANESTTPTFRFGAWFERVIAVLN